MRGRFAAAAEAALSGGARCLQYRDKSRDQARRLAEACLLRERCRHHRALLIVNDDPALAGEAQADGVHLGEDDAPITEARALLGAGRLIGVSCYDSLARALAAQSAGADYIAFGSFYPSLTKPGARRASLELLERARAELLLPIVAIGGITPENGAALIRAGAHALAVVGGVFGAEDPAAAARAYADLFETGRR